MTPIKSNPHYWKGSLIVTNYKGRVTILLLPIYIFTFFGYLEIILNYGRPILPYLHAFICSGIAIIVASRHPGIKFLDDPI